MERLWNLVYKEREAHKELVIGRHPGGRMAPFCNVILSAKPP